MRKIIIQQAKRYVDLCQRSLVHSQENLEHAKKILEHLESDRKIGLCPLPFLQDIMGPLDRLGAKLDGLIQAAADMEDS